MEQKRERRRRRRFPLHCHVQFERRGQVFAGTTVNISSAGFYCVAPEPLQAGEEIHCVVDLMEGYRLSPLHNVRLSCEAVVLRTELLESGFGAACHIRAYSMAPAAASDAEGRLYSYYQ